MPGRAGRLGPARGCVGVLAVPAAPAPGRCGCWAAAGCAALEAEGLAMAVRSTAYARLMGDHITPFFCRQGILPHKSVLQHAAIAVGCRN